MKLKHYARTLIGLECDPVINLGLLSCPATYERFRFHANLLILLDAKTRGRMTDGTASPAVTERRR